MGDWLNVPHLKALALRILNLVSDYLYEDRFGRERAKRVRVKAFKEGDLCLMCISKFIIIVKYFFR